MNRVKSYSFQVQLFKKMELTKLFASAPICLMISGCPPLITYVNPKGDIALTKSVCCVTIYDVAVLTETHV